MRVFISWSGDLSRQVASALRGWLPDVIQSLDPWTSDADIDAGKRWGSEISDKLAECRCGVLCLTPDNLGAPWLNFEAGALAKTLDDDTRVIPYLVGLSPSDIPIGPLSQFQAVQAEKAGTLSLMESINKAHEEPLADARLRKYFDQNWKVLGSKLKFLKAATPKRKPSRRKDEDILRELLILVRRIESRETPELQIGPTLRDWFQSGESESRIQNPHSVVPPLEAIRRIATPEDYEAFKVGSTEIQQRSLETRDKYDKTD